MQPLQVAIPGQPVQEAFISFSAEISQQTTESLLALCANLSNQRVQKVNLLLSTSGGTVINGLNLFNMLLAFPFQLITYNVGSVNSVGNVVFLAGAERYASAHSTFMFHGVGVDIRQAMRFEEKGLRETLDSVQADQARIAKIIAERTSIPPDEVEKLFLEAKTRNPEYAKTNGIINDIREVQIPPGAPVFQLVFQR